MHTTKILLAVISPAIILSLAFFIPSNINDTRTNNTEKAQMSLTENIYSFTVKDIKGNEVNLKDFEGKTLLIINVASKCGYTKQYSGLEALYQNYKDKGLVILGFPCNDFGGQEPGTNEEIAEFCSTTYGVTFPMFDKVTVLGDNKTELFDFLTANKFIENGDIKWNFEKFLVNKNGVPVARFKSSVKPDDKELIDAIEQIL